MQTDWFKGSNDFVMRKQLGATTGYEMVAWLDALGCIKTCCAHELAKLGDIPPHWQKRIDAIPTGKESIATIIRTLKAWKKWTHAGLTANYVQSFLFEITK
jgi:hypothetical protein